MEKAAIGKLVSSGAFRKAMNKRVSESLTKEEKRRKPGLVKKAFEVSDYYHDPKTGRIDETFYGNRKSTMSLARSRGLTPKKDEFGYSASREVPEAEREEAKKFLKKDYERQKGFHKGTFGMPILNSRKRREYVRAKRGLKSLEQGSVGPDRPAARGAGVGALIGSGLGLGVGALGLARGKARLADKAKMLGAITAGSGGLGSILGALREKRAYKLQGQTEVQGVPIAIENKKGSVRRGTDRDGHKWETKMKAPYGYIKGTKGADGEEVDAFVGPNKKAPNAFVVHQNKPDGKGYDEDKVILGTNSKAEAKKLFLQHYDDPKFLGPVAKVSMERLKELTESKGKLVKISRASYAAMLNELAKNAAAQDASAKPKPSTLDLVRKAGPAVGGTVGTAIGTLAGLRKGGLVRGALTGLGTGATLGWTPDMAMNAREEWKRYRSHA